MKKPRKQYKPKHANPASWKVAMMGQCLLTEVDREDFADPVKLAVDNAS